MLKATWFSPWLLLLSLTMSSFAAPAQENNWAVFKHNYLNQDGRIVDRENGNISHSEGQGYGMLLAVMNNDRPAFESIWGWTEHKLLRPSLWLFAWRYDPTVNKVTDTNDASDGDTLIAWALLLAGEKWHEKSWTDASSHIQEALINCLIIDEDNQTLLLPGLEGFVRDDGYVVNPSYFIFPAWESFWKTSHNPIWLKLKQSSLALLDKARFGKTQLPSDWVFVNDNGDVSPAKNWPARFSYDAIRIPLYLSLGDVKSGATENFRHFWSSYTRNATPAWIDVSGNSQANYDMSGGILAVRDLTMGDYHQMDKSLHPGEGYYLSALHMLSLFAASLKG